MCWRYFYTAIVFSAKKNKCAIIIIIITIFGCFPPPPFVSSIYKTIKNSRFLFLTRLSCYFVRSSELIFFLCLFILSFLTSPTRLTSAEWITYLCKYCYNFFPIWHDENRNSDVLRKITKKVKHTAGRAKLALFLFWGTDPFRSIWRRWRPGRVQGTRTFHMYVAVSS